SLDVTNGEDVGVSVFVQGCSFHCPGCFNTEAWDFNGGKEWTEEVENKFIELLSRPYIKRFTILGGEPLAEQNLPLTHRLLQIATDIILTQKKQMKIWLYTGYTFEDITSYKSPNYSPTRAKAVILSDYIVDGRFEIDKQDLTYSVVKYAGSTNQRIIDVQKSIEEERTVLWEG
ncbi:MAG: anaerobic ribonucleoside-triphosphate reductase activating protein, partial [Clostridia bacterium]|nr:anaerobic ribonucleoside-triphosphate reductase activating protein [Clostridia bacterium]